MLSVHDVEILWIIIISNTFGDRDMVRWERGWVTVSSAFERLALYAVLHLGLELFDLQCAVEEIVLLVHLPRSLFQHRSRISTGH